MTRYRAWLSNFDLLKPESTRRLLWTGLALLFLGLFLKLTDEVSEHGNLDTLDQRILIMIAHYRVAAFNGSAVDFTALGSPTVITLITVIGVLLLWLNHDRRGSTYLATGSIGAGIGTYTLKHLLTRERPSVVPRLVEVTGYSYPSGHSLSATSVYLLLMFLAWRYYRGWQARLALLLCASVVIGGVCLSRLYLGVHYPSDVLSGVFLGAAWTCLLTAYFSRAESGAR
ncbi:MAG: phosphatase PAP2 family protein [Oligoflexia bacterium]|nr:phosphatase PAP2 family protein [Oligoflexia bacterium]